MTMRRFTSLISGMFIIVAATPTWATSCEGISTKSEATQVIACIHQLEEQLSEVLWKIETTKVDVSTVVAALKANNDFVSPVVAAALKNDQSFKLKVSSAGSVDEKGVVQNILGAHFTANRVRIGEIKITFSSPFKDNVPIVVATAHKKVATIHIKSKDLTGFTAKGNAISSGRDEDTAFSFIVVEPNAK